MSEQHERGRPFLSETSSYLGFLLLSVLFITSALWGQHAFLPPRKEDFAGIWVRTVDKRTFLQLQLQLDNGHLQGTLSRPRHYRDVVGEGTAVTDPEVITVPVLNATVDGGILHFVTPDSSGQEKPEESTLMLWDGETAGLAYGNHSFMPRWILKRVQQGGTSSVSTAWPEVREKTFSPEVLTVQQQLHAMVVQDQAADRPPYSHFQELCKENYPILQHLFRRYGWLNASAFGKQTASDFWLLSVHQTDLHPQFAGEELVAMKHAVGEGEASAANYALFYDSVAQAEGKPQHWGTKTVCEKGERHLYPVDDLSGLDRRRAEAYLAPEASYLGDFAPCPK